MASDSVITVSNGIIMKAPVYNNEMALEKWLASSDGLYAIRRHAAWRRVPESEAVKSYLSHIMRWDAMLLRLDPKPIDFDIECIRVNHHQHVKYFARMGWDL